jgi:chemotaxis protein MotA
MKKRLDKGTLIGFAVAMGAMCGSILIEHGNLMSYVNISAAMIVFGGSLGVAFISFPFSVVMGLPKVMRQAFREPADQSAALVQQFVHLAERARKEGLLALEQETGSIDNPLLKKGVMLVVDGTDPELVKSILEIDIITREARHEVGIGLLEALGGFAPTLGIMGTVLGLIRILAHISNASELSASIAVAFTATLYGVGSANILWLPVAYRLKRRSAAEAEEAALVVDGVMSIQAGDNPRIVQEKLSAYVKPSKGKKAAKDAPAAAGAPATATAKAGA